MLPLRWANSGPMVMAKQRPSTVRSTSRTRSVVRLSGWADFDYFLSDWAMGKSSKSLTALRSRLANCTVDTAIATRAGVPNLDQEPFLYHSW